MRSETTTLTCDQEHTHEVTGRTVTFGLDGKRYESELCVQHEEALRGALAKVIERARRVPATGSKARPQAKRDRDAAIRSRAVAAGESVNPRGRLPQHIKDRYSAA